MQPETKNCQNCKKDFVVEPDDFLFYEKMKVPAPTFCPECRMIRRFVWRNEKFLYKRNCSLCKKKIIAIYDDNVLFPVYCLDCYKSDRWDASIYTQDYDCSKLFFEQWKNLFNKTPRQSLRQIGDCFNSEYSNLIDRSKNIYLSNSVILDSEYVYYSSIIDTSKQILDSFIITKSELLYENISSSQNYNCKYSYWSSNCIDCNFIQNCNNCQNCFGCVNLINKNYCIFNKQYSKEEYKERMSEINLSKYSVIQKYYKKFFNFILLYPQKYIRNINSKDCIGDELRDCKNVIYGFNCYKTENAKFSFRSAGSKDIIDADFIAGELVYEHAMGGSFNSQNIKFIIDGQPGCNNLEYTDNCQTSSNLFGCIALKNKKYCILNKQYTKEEYEELLPKIIKHMNDMPYIDKKGNIYKYGEFFPSELSPFAYNETVAQEYFPLTKEEALEQGYRWKDKKERNYPIDIKNEDIPNNINDVNNEILNKVIECEHQGKCNHQCTEAFKIVPDELQFYQRMNIPIPHLCPNCRHYARLQQRNPMKLWHRKCQCSGIESDNKIYKNTAKHPLHNDNHCPNEFETSYSPDRPEIVYCEKCYQAEVY